MRTSSRTGATIAATACFLAILGGAGPHDPVKGPGLFKDSRQALAVARARGETHTALLIAAEPGATAAVARRARSLGGDVRYRHDGVDYLRVRLPIDRASELAEDSRITATTVDVTGADPRRLDPTAMAAGGSREGASTTVSTLPGVISPDVRPPGVRNRNADTIPWPPRWSDYPLGNPYQALRDIDGQEFLAENPTFDGRGVTIALLDGSFDFLLPEFQTAYDLEGTPIPKVADYLNTTDPRDDAEEVPQWVDMSAEVQAQGRRVTFGGKGFTTPADGPFRIGFFNERRFNVPANAAYLDQDIDRNQNPRGDDGLFGVLWNEQSNDVWVDTNRDLSFADEKPMTDYIERGDFAVFGADDPETQVRESIGFTVQTDPANKFVSINVGIYQHSTEIMGHVVGNKEPEGRIEGVARGARLLSVFYGLSNAHGLIEGLIAAFEHPLTDLVVLEQSVVIASGPYLLADGRHPISIVAQRLIDRHEKLLFVPGSNSPGLGIVAEDGLAPGAVSVGGYQHRDSYLTNNGFEPEPADNMHWGGLSHGPSGIGARKPDLLAPSGQISVDIGYVYREFEQERRGLYQFPAGYFVDGGTSTAAPMAAGAAALVISAAKQTGVPYSADRLKRALTGSARFIPRLAAHEQGAGLVQVKAAYELLKALGESPEIEITGRAPIRTRLSHLLSPPHTGVGLYEREGWSVGDHDTRTLTFTRTSGQTEPMTFTVRWEGNDGTFSSASEVILPLNEPTELPVRIAVDSAGAHSALLVLEHPDVPGPVHHVLSTVVAPLRPQMEDGFEVTAEFELPRPGDRGVFVDVPPGTPALLFSATAADESPVRLHAISPGRKQLYVCAFDAPPGEPCSLADPEPGVWEINASIRDMIMEYDPGRPRPLPPADVTLSATLLGVAIDADVSAVDPSDPANTFDLPITLTNRFGAASAALVSGPLGSARDVTRSIAQGEQHVYELVVPEGATVLRAQLSEVSDPEADLDLYLIDCTAEDRKVTETSPERDRGNKAPSGPPPPCSPSAVAASVDADGVVEVRDPSAGRWVVVVDGYRVGAGGTRYEYVDVFTDPRLGAVAMTDVERPREPGATWTTTAHAWVATQPEEGRSIRVPLVVTSGTLATSQGHPVPLGVRMLPLGASAQNQ